MSVVEELDKFGRYVKQQAKSNLTKRRKKDTGGLYDGVGYKVEQSRTGAKLTFSFGSADDYWQFVDKGVKGKTSSSKAPNSPFRFGSGTGKSGGLTSGIKAWVKRKRFQFSNKKTGKFMSYESTSFLIIRSIWNKGIATTNFFTKPFEQAFLRLPDDIYAAYALEVDKKLNIIFK